MDLHKISMVDRFKYSTANNNYSTVIEGWNLK